MAWWFIRLVLPTAGSAYLIISAFQGLTTTEFILGMFMVSSFLANGWLERVSASPYVGDIEIETAPTGLKLFSLSLNESPDTLDQRQRVMFKIHSIS